jgi:hypothetical protein
MKARSTLFAIVLLSLVSGAAFAGINPIQTVPEPGVLELLALGGVVAAVVGIRNRNRRK